VQYVYESGDGGGDEGGAAVGEFVGVFKFICPSIGGIGKWFQCGQGICFGGFIGNGISES